ncbi:MAG TPA: SulP family inorganic anion transporter [Candidatus Margulisiibacteriota bacterium]|nr:SulP family inorganic anion transporter [Candidatus Margulisiibacteriota bacterium]
MSPAPADSGNSDAPAGWKAFFPPAQWLPAYESRWLGADLVAGITLAAYAIPVSLAYAGLAGLPPQVGIYGYLLGGLGYALFGSSRHLAVGPTSAISLMVGGTVGQMAGGDAVLYGQIATLAGLVLATMSLLAWLLRLSTLSSFISETILLGFKAGAGLTIASTQLAAFFGVPGGGDHFFVRLLTVGKQLVDLNPATTAVGVAALALLLIGDRLLPGRPVALMVVVLSILAVSLTPLGRAGLAVVGNVPSGLPALGPPRLRPRDVDGVIPLAFGCLLLAYIEGVSAARTFAVKHGYPLDARQELLGLGMANLLVAFGGGYPAAGGLSQSAVNEKAGAQTPLALVFASVTLGLCLVFLTGLVQNLPKTVLAAIVLVAVKGLIDVREMVRLRRVSRFEFRVAMVAFVAVLLEGVLRGVLFAALVSILMLLRRAAGPHVAFLGRIPGTRRFSDLQRHSDNERIEGVLAFRVEASLLYFNVENVLRAVLDQLRSEGSSVRLVVCDLSTSPYVDLAGARMLESLSDELAKRNVLLRVTDARASVRDLLRAQGADEKVGGVNRFASVADVVDHFVAESAHTRHPS